MENSMQRKRTTEQQRHSSNSTRPPSDEAHDWSRRTASSADQLADDIDGQLGPDELPDPTEVIMSREAKTRRSS
jgi:hypothetical protein